MASVLALLLTICAQEREGQPAPEPRTESRWSLGAHARVSLPVSSLDRDINILTPFPNPLLGKHKWSDFYQIGVGVAIQADLLWESRTSGAEAEDPGTVLGAYAAIGFDNYLGRKVDTGPDRFIDPDDLGILKILLGPKIIHGIGGGYFLDGHFGMGPVYYMPVDADLRSAPNQSMHGEFIAGTVALGLEVGGHAGLRTGSLAFVAGIDFRVLTSPDSGKDVELGAKLLLEFSLDLGVEVRF